MVFPTLTGAYTALLGLVYLALSAWVVMGRGRYKVMHGDGGVAPLNRRVRAHANFAEYVPFILFMVGLLEAGGARPVTIHVLLLPLLAARIIHPIGMLAPETRSRQEILRGLSTLVTWIVLAAASVMLLLRLL